MGVIVLNVIVDVRGICVGALRVIEVSEIVVASPVGSDVVLACEVEAEGMFTTRLED